MITHGYLKNNINLRGVLKNLSILIISKVYERFEAIAIQLLFMTECVHRYGTIQNDNEIF